MTTTAIKVACYGNPTGPHGRLVRIGGQLMSTNNNNRDTRTRVAPAGPPDDVTYFLKGMHNGWQCFRRRTRRGWRLWCVEACPWHFAPKMLLLFVFLEMQIRNWPNWVKCRCVVRICDARIGIVQLVDCL
ncbi:hypothetical protein Zmor_013095 [Zophobas morio]|uniref:Uncharacterized protein n=1 Tax=Zophobas morio TaxID=2755281 RepID=A0AA38IHT8_9CUCU|nr:hypothetical protein Zmor_013095 [Zophobas morio]